MNLHKKSLQVALAYVGIIVGAGLSSGQDLLQYFVCFGYWGILGVIILAVLNVVFGKIIVTTGCYYHTNSHDEVLEQIAHPITKKILDITLVIAGFVIGMVMIAGAGSNLEEQFGLPFWAGGLLCTLLIIGVSLLDFDKIMGVLGIFTPILIVMLLVILGYTFIGKSYDYNELNVIAQTIPPALPNVWISVINYYSLCALTGVSMAFILGGSLVRINVAKRGGLLGGALIGLIIFCATAVLFARVNVIKDAQIPMLALVQEISPVFATAYAFVIFGLIFNTAFSLFYSLASRIAGHDRKKLILSMTVLSFAGYALSFFGFKQLISVLYPILGYMGIVLLIVLLRAWLMNKSSLKKEQKIRRKMMQLARIKLSPKKHFGKKEQQEYHRLSKQSVAEGQHLIADIEEKLQDEINGTPGLSTDSSPEE